MQSSIQVSSAFPNTIHSAGMEPFIELELGSLSYSTPVFERGSSKVRV